MLSLRHIDRAIYLAERAIVVTALAIMSLIVFADVVHRLFATPHDGYIAPIAWFSALTLLTFFALRTRGLATTRAVPFAVGLVAAGYGVIQLFLLLAPNGVIWAQTLALVLTLWVGFLGASMATFERSHIRIEIADKIWPRKTKPYINLIANLVTAGFCFFLFALAFIFVRFTYQEYVSTEGMGGIFEGLPLPKWIAFLVLPISFAIMGSRFIGAAIGSLTAKDAK